MKAVCWHGAMDMRVETVPDPQIINPRDAIIKITSTTICGSDLHIYDGFIPTMKPGDIIGHEFMGEFVFTHELPLSETKRGYAMFKQKQDQCVKILLKP